MEGGQGILGWQYQGQWEKWVWSGDKIRKNKAVLKGRSTRDWRSKSKPQWHVSTVEDTAQSSQDRWMHCKNKSEWRKVSRESLITKREVSHHTLNRSCKDSAKREGDILKLARMAANDEKQEDEERHNTNELLKQLRKENRGR